jgi:hypothetical protein
MRRRKTMGLDVCAYTEAKNGKRIEAPSEWFDDTHHLARIGGWDADMNYFRGRSYAWAVEAITGISLYSPKIPNKDVRKIADSLARYYNGVVMDPTKNHWALRECQSFTMLEFHSLVLWFKLAADNDCWVEAH